jgi:hypothetical protein
MIPSREPLKPEPVIYNERCIGFVTLRTDGFDTTTPSGLPLGRFNTKSAAIRALLERMHRICEG